MESFNPGRMNMRVDWADFRIPPVNLWVMPQWKPDWRIADNRPLHHQTPPSHARLLHRRFLQLLAARGKGG